MIRYALNMDVPPSRFPFSYDNGLLFVGSCFSEHIAKRLRERYWNLEALPNGIAFNPLSILEPLKRIIDGADYSSGDLISHNGLWHGKYHHGAFSEVNREDALRKMNHVLHEFKRSTKSATHLFVTFGTAYAYSHIASGETFSNCHKIPSAQFEKYLLSSQEIVEEWTNWLREWHGMYPDMKVVFTVSPVKHLRDGVVENNLSKSILLNSVHSLVEAFDFTEYFPAYELVIDDLRDYRFFEMDGAHPSQIAIEYVFEKFCATYLDDPGRSYLKDVEDYLKLSNHKLTRKDGEEAIAFLKRIDEAREHLKSLYGLDI